MNKHDKELLQKIDYDIEENIIQLLILEYKLDFLEMELFDVRQGRSYRTEEEVISDIDNIIKEVDKLSIEIELLELKRDMLPCNWYKIKLYSKPILILKRIFKSIAWFIKL